MSGRSGCGGERCTLRPPAPHPSRARLHAKSRQAGGVCGIGGACRAFLLRAKTASVAACRTACATVQAGAPPLTHLCLVLGCHLGARWGGAEGTGGACAHEGDTLRASHEQTLALTRVAAAPPFPFYLLGQSGCQWRCTTPPQAPTPGSARSRPIPLRRAAPAASLTPPGPSGWARAAPECPPLQAGRRVGHPGAGGELRTCGG